MTRLSNIDLRLLRVFDAVVESGGFTAAQVRLNVSASKISSDIKALEERIGHQLCRRGRRGFELTAEGHSLQKVVKQLLYSLACYETEIAGLGRSTTLAVRAGILDALVTDTRLGLPDALRSYVAASPNVHLHLHADTPQELQAMVMDGRLDLALTAAPNHLPGLAYQPLHRETNSLHCAAGNALFDLPDAAITDPMLSAQRYVARSYWVSGDYAPIYKSPATATVNRIEAQLTLILTGTFIGYLPDHYAASWVRQGLLRPLLRERLSYDAQFFVILRPGKPPPPVRALIQSIRARFAEAGAKAAAASAGAAR